MAQGNGAAVLNGYTPFGPTDPSTPETVSIVLQANNLGDLERQVEAGMPGGYLSTKQFARQYGQSPLVIARSRPTSATSGSSRAR